MTRLLRAWSDGDDGAFDALVPLVYDDLRRIARQHLRRRGGALTLDTTALVHEAWLRLVDHDRVEWEDRGHFLAVYSVVTRNLLVDLARRRAANKRGGGRKRVDLDRIELSVDEQADLILALDSALQRLGDFDPRLARVVECRFFAGLTEDETARAMDCTERTVRRYWVKARALLQDLLEDEESRP
ncbi:MAG TPA: ECF-type sigma factor [Candidatus Krumholzibacteria bacterium]|nr:ECF-type sigma factor [Candidatus Krumholzibacteria bacterium]